MKYAIAWVVNSRPHLTLSLQGPRQVSRYSIFSAPSAFCFLPSAFSSLLSALCVALFAPRYPLCFHAIPNRPSCKSFVVITIQIAGGGGYLHQQMEDEQAVRSCASWRWVGRRTGSPSSRFVPVRFPAGPSARRGRIRRAALHQTTQDRP